MKSGEINIKDDPAFECIKTVHAKTAKVYSRTGAGRIVNYSTMQLPKALKEFANNPTVSDVSLHYDDELFTALWKAGELPPNSMYRNGYSNKGFVTFAFRFIKNNEVYMFKETYTASYFNDACTKAKLLTDIVRYSNIYKQINS